MGCIDGFSKSISVKKNANSLVQDWTRLTDSNSNDGNHYTRRASQL